MSVDESLLLAAHRAWFGELSDRVSYPTDHAKIWFEQSDDTDAMIGERFGAHLDAVAAADWPIEAMTRAAQIGLVIFVDQFPRNLYRGSAKAYALDALALRIARTLIAGGIDRFHLVERAFLYLPFEHSEAIEDQEWSVSLYEALLASAPEDQKDTYRSTLDFAEKHRAIIRRFGRFPHRNHALGRETTPEEAAFMRENGRGF